MKINYPLILDGGLSNALENTGHDLNNKLWTAALLKNDQEAIIQAHLDYLYQGAQCIITSSYQASYKGLTEYGFDNKTAEELIRKTVEVAAEAVRRFTEDIKPQIKPLIAASVGPYGAYKADGSEYRGNYAISDEVLEDFHRTSFRLLNDSAADFYACETIPSLQEAKVLASMLETSKKKAWISFSCKDERHINDGTDIEECVEYLSEHPNIFAIGLNCTDPQYVEALIKRIKSKAKDKKIVVYPNTGEVYDAKTKTWSDCSMPYSFGKMAQKWLESGADIIGGCCRVGPRSIGELSAFVQNGNKAN